MKSLPLKILYFRYIDTLNLIEDVHKNFHLISYIFQQFLKYVLKEVKDILV